MRSPGFEIKPSDVGFLTGQHSQPRTVEVDHTMNPPDSELTSSPKEPSAKGAGNALVFIVAVVASIMLALAYVRFDGGTWWPGRYELLRAHTGDATSLFALFFGLLGAFFRWRFERNPLSKMAGVLAEDAHGKAVAFYGGIHHRILMAGDPSRFSQEVTVSNTEDLWAVWSVGRRKLLRSTDLKYSMVRVRPSRSSILGSQPIFSLAKVMSGLRCSGSSFGSGR